MPSNPTLGGSDLVQSLQKAVPQKLLQGEEKLTTLLSRVLLKDVDRQLYSSNSCISTPVTHSGQWSMGGVSCVTSKWTHEKPKCASVVSLFALSQKMPVPDGACARTSLTTNTCRLWWACVCVCMWMYVYVGISVYVCVRVCDWDLGVTFSSGKTESFLMDTKEKEDLKRRQNLSCEAGTFLDLPFLLFLHPKLLPQVSPCFLCWAWLFLSHHFWLTNN